MSQKFNGVLKISQLFFRSNLIIHQTRINAKLYIWTDHIYPLFSSREKGWIHHQKVKVKVKLVTPRPSLSRPVYLKYLSYRTSQKKKKRKELVATTSPLIIIGQGSTNGSSVSPPIPCHEPGSTLNQSSRANPVWRLPKKKERKKESKKMSSRVINTNKCCEGRVLES